jgi:hypothetical protein
MTIDTNLIATSKCGKYVYPIDAISGAKTFAPIEYFVKNVQDNYGGSFERFVKEYVTRETKKYLAAGYTPDQIRDMASKCKNNKLPKINVKIKKHPNMPKKERKKRLASHAETSTIVLNEDGKEERVRTYPWTGNPDYFRSVPAVTDLGETTKEACLMPGIYLDSECDGCKYYDVCQCPLKYT